MRSSNRRVYAIGDCGGRPAIHPCSGLSCGGDQSVPCCSVCLPRQRRPTFPGPPITDPRIITGGPDEEQAHKKHGQALEVVRFLLFHNDRALAERKSKGFIKGDGGQGAAVGASIVGYQAGRTDQPVGTGTGPTV